MDRFIVREPRAGTECLQGNQIIAFPTSTAGNNMIPETFYTPYGSEFQNLRENRQSLPVLPQKPYAPTNMMQGQPQMGSAGIDPTYLAAYANSNAQFIAGHQPMHREQMERQMQFRADPAFGSDYQNRNLTHVERNNSKTFAQTVPADLIFGSDYQNRNLMHVERNNSKTFAQAMPADPTFGSDYQNRNLTHFERNNSKIYAQTVPESPRHYESNTPRVNHFDSKPKPQIQAVNPPVTARVSTVPPKKPNEMETPKNELQSQVLTRFDKLKALHKSGPRAFSGPVEKVLKWHKALQDIGVLIIFETVAKCVSVQPGKSCSKNLVVRDDSGPAMQVVYYEIDFLLPELKPPCTVRVVGRMMPGTCRLQAFSVRAATGDDVATLPRRAAVASHHVAKLCKEYAPNVDRN